MSLSAYDIILKPIITEKSMALQEERKYVFRVMKNANKSEIKKAVETVFDVKVQDVRTMNMLGKIKRQGAHRGKRADWKKAIVTLTEDSKAIEFFENL